VTAAAPGGRRTLLADVTVELSAVGCTFRYRRSRPRALLVTIDGNDTGELGTAPLDEIATALVRERPLELFVDAHEALGPPARVSDEWGQFFSRNRADLSRVHVLVGSKVVELTVAIAGHLSRTGNLIQIYTDAELFASRLTGEPRSLET
jgi:hypothetical protein